MRLAPTSISGRIEGFGPAFKRFWCSDRRLASSEPLYTSGWDDRAVAACWPAQSAMGATR
jgi:hypothetical protein